jgi:DNA polymerase III subunit beta
VKLSLMRENLARGLSVVSRAVQSRPTTLPVLSNILLHTADAGLKLTGTNLEIGITSWVPGKVETDGALTVPARLLTDYVASLSGDDRVELDTDGGTTLRLRCGRQHATLKGIDADEFPAIPATGDRPTTRVPQRVFRQALGEVTFAAATDEARPILTGVLTRFTGDRVTLAAADNYRIAVKTVSALDSAEERTVVVPARSYAELARILSDTDDPFEIILAPTKNQVLFHADGTDLLSRLIDGQFPNYQQVLPTSYATRVVVEREDVLKAVRLSGLIAMSASNVVKLAVTGDGSTALIISAAAEVGENEGEIDASVEGDPVTIAFNARYLEQALQNMSGERLSFEFNGPLAPGVLRATGDADYIHVIMPVRTAS